MENLVVEILDDEGHPVSEGEEGNVVITDLTNFGMPFIRYVNGDRAVAGAGSCPCGRGLPLLKKVTGRRLDMLRTKDGRLIPGEFFPHLLKDFPAIVQFQVMQECLDRIEVRAVLKSVLSEADRRVMNAEFHKIAGESTRVDFRQVESIPLTPAGKLQVVVNRLPDQECAASESLAATV